jgi:uncharacterized membrane-anchored protein YhcB (DUF1043 family)
MKYADLISTIALIVSIIIGVIQIYLTIKQSKINSINKSQIIELNKSIVNIKNDIKVNSQTRGINNNSNNGPISNNTIH